MIVRNGNQYNTNEYRFSGAERNLAELGMNQADNRTGLFQNYAAPAANMFGTLGGMYNTGMNNMGQMFGSYANAFGAYGNAIGNIAGNASQARANENAGRYAAYAGGLDSYAGMLGNLGSSALAGYGSAANAAMQSHAQRETAAMKAMSDMVAANQAAAAQYGVGRDAALASTANAFGTAGAGMGMARGNLANAAGNMAGAGSSALAGLGTGIADAAASSNAATAQSQAALSAAIANGLAGMQGSEMSALAQNSAAANNSLAGILNATSNAQAGLGSSTAGFGSSLGNNITNAANNSLGFTRDMAKLDLARTLGLASANVAGQGMGAIGGSPGFTISGPEGVIASGTGGFGAIGGGGFSQPPAFLDPTRNTPWYSAPQVSDGGGMANLTALRQDGLGALGNLAAGVQGDGAAGRAQVGQQADAAMRGIMGAGVQGRDQLAAESTAGRGTIQDSAGAAMGRIGREGDASRAGILATLADGSRTIGDQSAGMDMDSRRTFAGLDASRRDITNSGVLDSLNQNFRGGYDALQSAYQQGRQDPRTLLNDVLLGTQQLMNPLLGYGRDAYDQWMGGFPEPIDPVNNPMFDPVPYLSALQAGWSPFQDNLGRAMTQQNANILGMIQSGRQDYGTALGDLGSRFDDTRGDLDALGQDSMNAQKNMLNHHIGIENPGKRVRNPLSGTWSRSKPQNAFRLAR
jgi:hypothetical protein